MTTLREIVKELELKVVAGHDRLDRDVSGGYASDLLSFVMGHARKGSLWVTLQSHVNIVAVASVAELAGIVVTEGAVPDTATVTKAEEEGIPLLLTPRTTYAVVEELAKLGIHGIG